MREHHNYASSIAIVLAMVTFGVSLYLVSNRVSVRGFGASVRESLRSACPKPQRPASFLLRCVASGQAVRHAQRRFLTVSVFAGPVKMATNQRDTAPSERERKCR